MTNEISEIQFLPVKPRDGLIGFASLVLNNALYMSSIGVHVKIDGTGYRLTFPTKVVGSRQLNIYHPINANLSRLIEEAIFEHIRRLNMHK